MIKVEIVRIDNKFNRVTVLGHANYALYGKDIVCSAVSSIVTTTVNAILTFDKNYIKYKTENDVFDITINDNNEVVDNLISNMINLLKELEIDYPKNIKIKEENL